MYVNFFLKSKAFNSILDPSHAVVYAGAGSGQGEVKWLLFTHNNQWKGFSWNCANWWLFAEIVICLNEDSCLD